MNSNPQLNNILELKSSYEQIRLEQLALCDVLEEIADSLPYNVDEQICIHTAKTIVPLIKRAHKIERENLFPLLQNNEKCAANLTAITEKIKKEHKIDEYNAEELAEILLSYGTGQPSHSAEATGYVIRGFFESLRRHIEFVHEIINPVLQHKSTN